jgi:hypothetical protein
VSLDELQEKLAEFEDYIQSTDVAAMQSTSLLAYPLRWSILIADCRALIRFLLGCCIRVVLDAVVRTQGNAKHVYQCCTHVFHYKCDKSVPVCDLLGFGEIMP